MSNQSKAYLLTLLAVTFWGTSASAFKIALRYVEPYTLLFYSVLFSSLALAQEFLFETEPERISRYVRARAS